MGCCKKRCLICNSKRVHQFTAKFVEFLVDRMFCHREKSTSLIVCKDCGFIFSEYRPNAEEMERLYKDYRGEEYQKQREKYEKKYTKALNQYYVYNEKPIKHRRTRLFNILNKYIKVEEVASLLDYGGDNGQFIPLEFKNAKKYVYEISKTKPINDEIVCINNRDELYSQKYEVVMCSHVLEHVSYPKEIIRDLYNLVDENGYIYIEVPNQKPPISEIYLIHEHINYFDIKTLLKLNFLFNDLKIVGYKEDKTVLSIILKKRKLSFIDGIKLNNKISCDIICYNIKNIIKKIKLCFRLLIRIGL